MERPCAVPFAIRRMFIVGNGLVPFRSPCYGKDQCGRGQAPSLRKMVNRNGNFVVEQSFAVPFDHVTERANAEGVKPLPYGRWFTGTVMLLVDGLAPFLLLMLRIFVAWNGLLPFRLAMLRKGSMRKGSSPFPTEDGLPEW